MKVFLSLIIAFFTCAALGKPGKYAKWTYLGATVGRGAPVDGKAASFAGMFYESHFDDLDFTLGFDQSFGSDVKVSNYTAGFGKTIEKDEGPSLRVFIGAGINTIVLNQKAYDGVQSVVGFDVCPPMKALQVCARYDMRFVDSEFMSKASQEFSLVLKKISF